jgi:hypothetical protein
LIDGPSGWNQTGGSGLQNRGLTSVRLPSSLTRIGDGTFRNNRLTNVTIPESVRHVGEIAFDGAQLTRVTIGANVSLSGASIISRETGSGAFMYQQSQSLTEVYNNNGRRAGTYTYNGSNWSYSRQ